MQGRKEGSPRVFHGKTETNIYGVWVWMRARCLNRNTKYWDRYGGRGITFCKEWDDFLTFEKWAIASNYRHGLWLDRKDNDGNYEPDNCQWVTPKASGDNRNNTWWIEAFGERKTLTTWLSDSRCKTNATCVQMRIKRGWTPELALSTPTMKSGAFPRLNHSKKSVYRLEYEASLANVHA